MVLWNLLAGVPSHSGPLCHTPLSYPGPRRQNRSIASLARLASYNQHNSKTTCYTPVEEGGTEASIRVPRMFKSHT
jgi:hypothetical protein